MPALIGDALDSLAQIVTPRFRAIFLKTIGLTILLLAVAAVGLDRLVTHYAPTPGPVVGMVIAVVTGLGLLVGAAFLVAPLSSIVAGLFLDDMAELAERDIRPDGPFGRALPIGQALWIGLRFGLLAILVNLVALAALLVPGLNLVAFLVANGYLLGRAFFELAAMRYLSVAEANALRRRHAGTVFVAGLVVAGFVAVPVVNLATPLFATAFMVRVNRRLLDAEGAAQIGRSRANWPVLRKR